MEIEFNESGIYAIINTENEKFYVGSAVNLKLRWRLHRNELNREDHKNSYLQRSWIKYGQHSFIFTVLELITDKSNLIEREQFHIDALKPEYNLNPTAGSMLGFRHSEETKRLIGNRVLSEETNLRMSASHLGVKLSEYHVSRIVEGRKGYAHSDETKKNIGEANSKSLLGSKHSDETKAKMSAAKKGKPKSEEAKANMRLAWIKRKQAKDEWSTSWV